ncbi:MAG: succinate dehydrogenase, cytochrome b556 subunit [Burkholderiales bacterium]
MQQKKRPVYLNLLKIRQPVSATVSILHRISGALLFLFIPYLLYTLQLSLSTPEHFELLKQGFDQPLVKLTFLVLIWAYLHHFFAGLRFLLLDLDIGVDLAPSRASSWAVLAISLPLTLLIGIRLW